MAKINTVFSFTDNVSGPLARMNSALHNTESGFSRIQAAIVTANSAMSAFSRVKSVVDGFSATVMSNVQAFQYQAEQELKLETIMKKRMNATRADVQYIKDLASAEQQLGIYGDEMILQGAQELASFTSNKEAIAELIPAMNNLIAQQYGYSASGMNFQQTADMMGKVLSGQTGALSRLGYIFSEDEKKMLQTGNEMQRAATLAKIINDNVGEMNHALAATDAGAVQSMANTFGDLKEELGRTLMPISLAMTSLKNEMSGDFLVMINNALASIAPTLVAMTEKINSAWRAFKQMIEYLDTHSMAKGFVQGAMGVIGVLGTLKLALTIGAGAWKAYALSASMAVKSIMASLGPLGAVIAGLAAIGGIVGATISKNRAEERAEADDKFRKRFGRDVVDENETKLMVEFLRAQARANERQKELQAMYSGADLMRAIQEDDIYRSGMRQLVEAEKALNAAVESNNAKMGAEEFKFPEFSFGSDGALKTSDVNSVDIADDYRDLLNQKALQKFNLNVSQMTPEINIGSQNFNEKADIKGFLKELSTLLYDLGAARLAS